MYWTRFINYLTSYYKKGEDILQVLHPRISGQLLCQACGTKLKDSTSYYGSSLEAGTYSSLHPSYPLVILLTPCGISILLWSIGLHVASLSSVIHWTPCGISILLWSIGLHVASLSSMIHWTPCGISYPIISSLKINSL